MNNPNLYDIGLKLIESAINIDESLAGLLKEQVKLLKKKFKMNTEIQDLQKNSDIIRNLVLALILTDEKIKAGIELCQNHRNQ